LGNIRDGSWSLGSSYVILLPSVSSGIPVLDVFFLKCFMRGTTKGKEPGGVEVWPGLAASLGVVNRVLQHQDRRSPFVPRPLRLFNSSFDFMFLDSWIRLTCYCFSSINISQPGWRLKQSSLARQFWARCKSSDTK
jgi:hypothetical protein